MKTPQTHEVRKCMQQRQSLRHMLLSSHTAEEDPMMGIGSAGLAPGPCDAGMPYQCGRRCIGDTELCCPGAAQSSVVQRRKGYDVLQSLPVCPANSPSRLYRGSMMAAKVSNGVCTVLTSFLGISLPKPVKSARHSVKSRVTQVPARQAWSASQTVTAV